MSYEVTKPRRHSSVGIFILAVSAAVAGPALMHGQRGGATTALARGEWIDYGGDAFGMKYSPLAQITPGKVNDLRVVWRWASADRALQQSSPALRASRYEGTPLMVNGVLYTVTPLGIVAAIDPATGQTRWLHDPESYKAGRHGNTGHKARGLAYWTDGTWERLFLGTNDAYLLSIDAKTGAPDPAFGERGKVDITIGMHDAKRAFNISARRPLVAGNVVVVGNSVLDPTTTKEMPPGYVHAFDVRSGKRLWTFHTVPRAGEFGFDTWLENSAEYTGNTNVWAGMVYDPELDYVYMPTSTPTSDWYGGHRPGDNLFAESLICVEAKTGKRVWHFQAVHHGLWDYDFPSHPTLGEVTVNGQRIKAVMQISKQNFVYAFDRRSGKPLWPIEERAVPQSTVPGERTAATQPFPTKPAPYDLQGSTEENLIDFTPALKQRALDQMRTFVHGPLFTPPSEKGTLVVPGPLGGANWGGAAFDPETGILYVPSRTTSMLSRMVPGNPKQNNFRYVSGGAASHDARQALGIDDLPLFKPPYARVTAIDMGRGEHVWMAPIGNGPRNHPLLRDLDLAALGDGVLGGSPLVTKTLLFVAVTHLFVFGEQQPPAWAKWNDPGTERKLLYVFDKQSGKVLRAIELDGLSAAAPMTYLHQGKQYVVIPTGGGPTSELVALALADGA